jgi:phosphoserine phosphatase
MSWSEFGGTCTWKRVFTLVAYALLTIVLAVKLPAAEPHASEWTRDVVATREAILAQRGSRPGSVVFLAFWDFDGTILRGDCSEGLQQNNRWVYPGLAQRCIEAGLSRLYPAHGDFERFWSDYRTLDQRVGHWLAYPFIPQMLAGARAEDVRALAREHFQGTLAADYFASSVAVFGALEDAGIENHVISASADIFVKAAATTLHVPEERFHGIRVRIDTAGRLTHELEYPVTWSEGKLARLLQIVAEVHARAPATDVVVLAAFGNSYSTDGPFLEYVARQTLPAGRPVVGMINGGPAPERYRAVFREVEQRAVVGK